jgi:HSP20 family protein
LIRTGFFRAVFADQPWIHQTDRCAWRPPTDLYETERAVVVRVEIAGMRREDFEVAFDSGVLHIRGRRSDVTQKRAYHMMEIPFGCFCTHVDLSGAPRLNPEEMSAQYENGFLTVTMPKADTPDTGDRP